MAVNAGQITQWWRETLRMKRPFVKKNAENNLDGTWNQWEILKEDGNKKNSYT